MRVIQAIAEQRRKLLDGIDANEGDINLQIFEDFYPDEAHFIYELLQNAEDAGATEVAFDLSPSSCAFEHNGTRHFNERDIRGITGIFNSSKKNDPDKIGKFGVGFKSVFVYTDTPVIYSKDYSFKILKLVLPQEVTPKPELGVKTRFEFPFNNPKKNVQQAFDEVKAGLEALSETTLLFLKNLRYIGWKVGRQKGEVLREQHLGNHVEVLKLVDGKEVLSSHWLRFSAPVADVQRFSAPMDGVERQQVSVAYELTFVGERKSFDSGTPLSKQLKIRPAVKGKVSVFFPAEKETSGLRFHLHAPFIPELSRASIKNSPENLPLFEQLAGVVAKSLHEVKQLGLLTGEFLSVLPNNVDHLPERYQVIRKAVIEEMQSCELVPTHGGDFAPASRLIQARAPIKRLLNDDDLAFVTEREDAPTWAIGATQKNSFQDRFLDSLGLPTWDIDSLREFMEERACESHREALQDETPDPEFIQWLSKKSSEWHQELYAVLLKLGDDENEFGDLADTLFVRLASGTYESPSKTYFQSGPWRPEDPYPRVDDEVLTCGTKKTQQSDARKLLEILGVGVPGEREELSLLLRSRYGPEGEVPSDEVYVSDLQRMMDFLDKDPHLKGEMGESYIFRVDSPDFVWGTAVEVYLDAPYQTTGLAHFHNFANQPSERRWPLDPWYLTCGLPRDRIARFAALCGCEAEFQALYVECRCNDNPRWSYLLQAPGERYGNYINRDFAISPQTLRMLKSKQLTASQVVWTAMCRAKRTVLSAYYQMNDRGGPHTADSQLICTLKELEWVPLSDGRFVKPRQATPKLLPTGFPVDSGYKWLELVEFGKDEKKRSIETAARAQRREELGFESEESLQRALAFTQLPESEQDRFLSAHKSDDDFELPERPVRNIDIRKNRVSEQARNTSTRTSEIRPRAVQLGAEVAKVEAKSYLTDQYTNSSGQMICQVCKAALPFKLSSGSYYFEAVELVPGLSKRYREAYLSLCPNHAAAYQYANAQRNGMLELVLASNSNEIEIELGGEGTTVYFTQMHLADAKACLEAGDDDE